MDINIEKRFLNQFICKEKRNRLSYELWGKKRKHALSRFCHNSKELLIMDKVIVSGKDISYTTLKTLIQQNCGNKKRVVNLPAYIMAYNNSIDGIFCDYEKALNNVLGNGMAAIIIFDGFAIVETEQEIGSAQKLVLKF